MDILSELFSQSQPENAVLNNSDPTAQPSNLVMRNSDPVPQPFYLDQGKSKSPISFSIYDQTPRHLLYIKNQVAAQKKQSNVLDAMFDGDALGMNADEYEKFVNSKMAGETANKMAVDTASMDDSKFFETLNEMRRQVGMEPIAPRMPELQQPGWQQAAAAALTAMFSPEHAFDVAAVPFQHQKQNQAQEYQQQMMDYEQRLGQHNQLMKLSGVQLDRQANNADLNYRADLQREMFARDTNQQNQSAVDQRNYGREMFLRETDFKFKAMDREDQSRVAFAYLGQALNPNSSAAERTSAAEVFNRLTGGDVKAFEGKTLAEQASELDMTLAKNQDNRAQAGENRAQELFPLQKESLSNQNKADRIKLTFLPQQLQLDLEAARAGIDNVRDTIRSRNFSDDLALSEQERAYIGMQQDNARSSLSGLSTQLEQLGVEERALGKELDTADTARKKEIAKRLDEIKTHKSDLIGDMSELNSRLKEVDEVLKTNSGVGAQAAKGQFGADVLGTPYSWGGGGAKGATKGVEKGANTKGFDCSGFTCYVAKQEWGVNIPRTAAAQFEALQKVDNNSAKDGDFLYWRKGNSWHTAVIIFKDGEPWIRHAPQTGSVVKDQKLSEFKTSKEFVGVRRARPKDKNIPDKPAIFNGGN